VVRSIECIASVVMVGRCVGTERALQVERDKPSRRGRGSDQPLPALVPDNPGATVVGLDEVHDDVGFVRQSDHTATVVGQFFEDGQRVGELQLRKVAVHRRAENLVPEITGSQRLILSDRPQRRRTKTLVPCQERAHGRGQRGIVVIVRLLVE
jgi:hypothetical protein